MRVALIGTRGVPARYGGFETAVEEIGQRLVNRGHHVQVYCRAEPGQESLDSYLGMELIQLPAWRRRHLETLAHTALSVIHPSLRGVDAAIVFNAANAPLLPVLRARRIPVATHVDGLEWQRAKWGPMGRPYYRAAEALAVRWSDLLIADAKGIADYYAGQFGAPTRQIAYGAPILAAPAGDALAAVDLTPGQYHLVVARFERENHVLEIVEGYVASAAKLPLVVVGSAPYSDEYTAAIHQAADERVRLLGGVWDQTLLDQLYQNARCYLHGHSVGGTNPSLLRAAGAGTFVASFNVAFNREVVGRHGGYWRTPEQVAVLIEGAEAQPERCRALGRGLQAAVRRYNWDDVAFGYEQLLTDLATGRYPKRRPSGLRGAAARQLAGAGS